MLTVADYRALSDPKPRRVYVEYLEERCSRISSRDSAVTMGYSGIDVRLDGIFPHRTWL